MDEEDAGVVIAATCLMLSCSAQVAAPSQFFPFFRVSKSDVFHNTASC